jgi:hypothetical protein
VTGALSGGQPPALAQGTNVGSLLKHGWELLLSSIGNAVREFGVWMILLLPVYLSARRWALANRHEGLLTATQAVRLHPRPSKEQR